MTDESSEKLKKLGDEIWLKNCTHFFKIKINIFLVCKIEILKKNN